jgi:hypothetical protein
MSSSRAHPLDDEELDDAVEPPPEEAVEPPPEEAVEPPSEKAVEPPPEEDDEEGALPPVLGWSLKPS